MPKVPQTTLMLKMKWLPFDKCVFVLHDDRIGHPNQRARCKLCRKIARRPPLFGTAECQFPASFWEDREREWVREIAKQNYYSLWMSKHKPSDVAGTNHLIHHFPFIVEQNRIRANQNLCAMQMPEFSIFFGAQKRSQNDTKKIYI